MAQGLPGLRDISVDWDEMWCQSGIGSTSTTSASVTTMRRRVDYRLSKQSYMSHAMQRLMRSLPTPLVHDIIEHMNAWHMPALHHIKPLVYVCEQKQHPDYPMVQKLLQVIGGESNLCRILEYMAHCPLSCRDLDRFFWHTLSETPSAYWIDSRLDWFAPSRIVCFTDVPPTPLQDYHVRIDLSQEQRRISQQWCKTHFDVFGRGEAWVCRVPRGENVLFVPCQVHFFFFALKTALLEYIHHLETRNDVHPSQSSVAHLSPGRKYGTVSACCDSP